MTPRKPIVPAAAADEPARAELQALLRRREQLMGQRVSEGNRLVKGLSPKVADSINRNVAWLDQEIAQL